MRAPTSRGPQKAVIPHLCCHRPAKNRYPCRKRRRPNSLSHDLQRHRLESVSQPHCRRRFPRQWADHPIRCGFGAADYDTWIVPNGSHCIYGRVAGGIQADMVAHVAVTLTASRTIPRQGGDNSTVQAASRSRSEPHQTSRFSLDWRRPLTFGARPWACAERSLAKRATCSALCCCMIRNTRCWASLRHAMTFRRWSEVTRASLNCAVQPSLAVRVD